MIDVNSLRRNNYVLEEVLGIVSIEGINADSVWIRANHLNEHKITVPYNYHIGISAINPIPLTHSILEACGFNYIDMMFGGPDSVMQYWRNDWLILERGGIVTLFNHKESEQKVELKYLHELQNLWYMLMKTELQVNL